MTYVDDYKARLSSYGATDGAVFGDSTTILINNSFSSSPNYKIIPINGNATEVRVLSGKTLGIKELLFKPGKIFTLGSMATLNNKSWIFSDFIDDPYYPKATIQRCSDILKWKDSNGTIKQYPCVVTDFSMMRSFRLNETNIMSLPVGELNVFVTYNADTKSIIEGHRFIIAGRAYKAAGLDNIAHVYDDNGMLRILIKMDTISTNDDMINGLADNSVINKPPVTGGKLW